MTCHVLDTGHCLASEHHMMRGGRRNKMECHALVALLQHPREGWLLWDAGYSSRLVDETRKWPFWLYRLATPLRLSHELEVVAQLPRFGLSATDIRHVIVSHFHADHIAGLKDFPQATIIASRVAYEAICHLQGFAALRRAFVPGLMPEDISQRVRLIDDFSSGTLGALGPTCDLFGDGLLQLMPLPGHARGQLGLLAQTNLGSLLFTADGAYLRESVRRNQPPHRITHLIIDDASQVRETLSRLHQFANERPDLEIVPTHCPEAFRKFVEAPP
jgi:glyoxylase-like metal-dependent hydrolase (beta-lactamase superfamily II)